MVKMSRKKWKLGFVALAIFAVLLLIFFKPSGPPHILWVEIHDFSPGYGTDEMDGLLEVLDRHHVDRIIVFVIPNRDEIEPIHKDDEFVEYLHGLQERGVEIGAHGYSHKGFEFYKSSNETEQLTEKSMDAFSKANVSPRSFYPPRYRVKKEGLEILKEHYSQIFLLNKVIIDRRTYPYHAYEFMPGVSPKFLAPLAKYAYNTRYKRSSSPVFRLNIHLSDVDADTLEYLDEFLTLTDGYFLDLEELPVPQNHEELIMEAAASMEEPRQPYGIKRTSYALIYNINMYEATEEPKYRERAEQYTGFLLSKQRPDGGWSSLEDEERSSYDVLESSMAVWALSEAYVAGIGSTGLQDGVIEGGDFIVRKVDFLTFKGSKRVIGLKPNAMAFLGVALAKAHLASAEMYSEDNDTEFLEKANVYKEGSLRIADALTATQNVDGSWYDGPYYLPMYSWKTKSSWYQAMAIMGLASAYNISGNDVYYNYAIDGITWFENLEGDNNEIRGELLPDGTISDADDGSIMALQSLAFCERAGVDTKGRYWPVFLYLSNDAPGWDGNLAFAYSELLAASAT